MRPPDAKRVVVYSRMGCPLCDQLIEELLPLVRDRWTVEVIDIDSDPDLLQRFNDRVPLLEVDGRLVCQYWLDRPAIRELLLTDAAVDGPPRQA